jgi:hypothetical protein
LRAGLPHRHLPLSGFLTLSTVSSPRILVALFQATSAHRLPGLQSFFHQNQPECLSAPFCSPVIDGPSITHMVSSCAMHSSATRRFVPSDFRALLRLGIRHSVHQWSGAGAAALLAFVPSEVYGFTWSARNGPPLMYFRPRRPVRKPHLTFSSLYFRVSNQKNRGSTSAEAEPTPLRFATLHERLFPHGPKASGQLGTPIPNTSSRKSKRQFRPTTVRLRCRTAGCAH